MAIHNRDPSPREIQTLGLIHHHADRIVLVPVVVNGEERYGIAFLSRNSEGALQCDVLATVILPQDHVLDRNGIPGVPYPTQDKKYLN